MRAMIQTAFSLLRREQSASREQTAGDVFAEAHKRELGAAAGNRPGSVISRHLAGILFADIVDYTRLTEQDEEGTHQRVIDAIMVLAEKIAANRGRIAHVAGDAILAEFDSAESALRCAIEVQLAARQWNAGVPAERLILFRIGVNFGQVIPDHGDIYGNSVNLAARLEGLAGAGEICVSATVVDALDGKSDYRFVALGEHSVKNVSEPVSVYGVELDDEPAVEAAIDGAVEVSAVTP